MARHHAFEGDIFWVVFEKPQFTADRHRKLVGRSTSRHRLRLLKCSGEEGCHMQRAKRLLEGLRIHHLGFGFFWTVTFIVLAGFQGAGAIADYWQIRTDAHAPGRRSPGHPVRFPPSRAAPLDSLGGELHAQRSRASLLPRIPFRPRRRRDRSCGRHSHGWLLHLVLPALGNVLRNRRPAARSHLHSPFGGHVGGPLLAHLPSALNRRSSDRRLRAAVSGASLPSEEPRRD